MIRKVEMERFTVISARPFDEVVAAPSAMPVGGLRSIDFERPVLRPEGLGGSSSFDDLHCKNDAFRGHRQQKQ